MEDITPELAKTIAKVRRLLEMSKHSANSATTNENEMRAAAAAADRIMQEHRISQAMLEQVGDVEAEPMIEHCVAKGGRRTAWRETVLAALTTHYGCAWYLSSGRVGGEYYGKGREGSKGVQSYTVVGTKSDVEIVEYMYTYITNEIQRLCRWHTGGKGVKYALAWMVGCADGISRQFYDLRAVVRAQALAAQQAAQAAARAANPDAQVSCALVVLDKRVDAAREYMKSKIGTKSAASISGARHSTANAEGYGVGKNIPLTAALTGGKKTPALT
jgi:hypothetical protein